MLLGAQHYFEFFLQSSQISRHLFAIKTKLGHSLSGIIQHEVTHPLKHSHKNISVNKVECRSLSCNYECPYMDLDKYNYSLDSNYETPYLEFDDCNLSCNTSSDIRNIWNLSVLGISDINNDDKSMSNSDKQIIDEFEKQLEFNKINNRYVTGLLWKKEDECKTGLAEN